MKINEVEAAVGVTKKNIRFYEEEGLISPRREPGNGYRSYSEADVERLRRIKLLRKLDVPLAEIRQMLEGECTLAEEMTRQLERLHTRRTDLDEAVNFCTLLQKEPVSLNELDVEQTLARLTAKEEQGVTFVDIEQVDRKAERISFYEEEGLISPRREPGNGYRSYSEADVERLRRIKLLRKLDVPLAEIRQMLEGECTLAEEMTRQLERLHTRRTDLDEAVNFCTLLQKEPVSLNELDVEQTLARLTAKEEQGVTFVDIEQVDRKAERIRGALVGAGLFTAIMLLSIGIMAWAFCVDPQDVPPLPLLVVLFGIPAGCIIGTLKVLVDRLKEIGKGEEDAYRNY